MFDVRVFFFYSYLKPEGKTGSKDSSPSPQVSGFRFQVFFRMTLKFTKPVALTAALLLFLAALEAGVLTWRHNVPVSTAAVSSSCLESCVLPSCVFSGSFQRSIDIYHADRRGELKLPGPDGSSLAVFYFEWDQVECAAIMGIAGHPPEECNVAAGFNLKSNNPSRIFVAPDLPRWCSTPPPLPIQAAGSSMSSNPLGFKDWVLGQCQLDIGSNQRTVQSR